MSRINDLIRFYATLEVLADSQGGGRHLADCNGRITWPRRGVYFFFEPDEPRTDSGGGSRVVRVGTHALSQGSRTRLWNRLAQHRGASSGNGNHRGSIFRLLVGEALIARDGLGTTTWGLAGSRGEAARRSGTPVELIAPEEGPIERDVSTWLGAMRVVVLAIDDEPGPKSLRGFIERNAIALLSNRDRPPLDPPTAGWLGGQSPREKVRRSGLWNQDHVEATYDPAFLDVLSSMAIGGIPMATSVHRPPTTSV